MAERKLPPPHNQFLSIAALRIAFAASFLISELYRYNFTSILEFGRLTFVPKGIVAFLFAAAPSAEFFRTFQIAGLCLTIIWMFGIFSRISGLLSFAVNLILVSLYYSFRPAESHEYNVMLLGQFIIAIVPSASRLSLIKEKEGSPSLVIVACWCVQLIAAWMFFNAFLYKFLFGGLIPWALSDNMRNIIGFQQIRLGRPMSDSILWLSQHHILYSAMAVGNLVCQAATMLGVLFFTRPRIRLISAVAFVFETLGLGFVMGRWDISPWNPHWLVLTAAFIDWDYFFGKTLVTLPKIRLSFGTAIPLAVTLVEIVVSILGIRLPIHRLYPFTYFPMYSQVFAKTPVMQHQTYEFFGPYVDETYANRRELLFESSVDVIKGLDRLENEAHRLATRAHATNVVFKMGFYSIPQYPEKAVPKILMEGTRAILKGQNFTALACQVFTNRIKIESKNLADNPEFTVSARKLEYSFYAPVGFRTATIRNLGEKLALTGKWENNILNLNDKTLEKGADYLIEVEANLPDGSRQKFWNPISQP